MGACLGHRVALYGYVGSAGVSGGLSADAKPSAYCLSAQKCIHASGV